MNRIQQTQGAASLYFAHLSDPHLTSLQGVHWQDLLNKRLLGYLSWRRRRRAEHSIDVLDALLEDLHARQPQHIVVTGDLTHIGLPDEFRQARAWLERVGNSDQVTVIPGNHDAYAPAPWGETFSRWEPYMHSDAEFAAAGASAADTLFPSLRIRDGVAFIGLSSSCATAPFLATGSLGAVQIARLEELLEQTARQGLFRTVLLHHPPRVEDEKWRKRLTDGKALCNVLERAGAELVLHGHGHRAHRSTIAFAGREIPVFGIPSASAVGRKTGRHAQYYLYRVARDGDSWSIAVEVRGWRAASRTFGPAERFQLSLPVMSSTSA